MPALLHRRAFLGGTAAIAHALVGLSGCKKPDGVPKGPQPGAPREGQIVAPPPPVSAASMPKRKLGRTGVEVSIVGLGGFHIGLQTTEQESIRIIRSAIDRGVTFLDNCWDYNGGRSEERTGKALRDGYRERVFLMTKLDGRTKQAAAEQLDQSLARLGTDHVDLAQIHEVIRPGDPARCFAPGGCIEALIEAKRAGKVRFLGFTGHKDPDIHLAMLQAADQHGFAFDAVQMPLNVMDAHVRSFEHKVLPILVDKGIAVLGMKSLGSGIILESRTARAVDCLHYTMNLPTSVVITGCDTMGILDQAIDAALSFRPMPPEQVTALLERTRDAAQTRRFERFKTSTDFDGTGHHPEWLERAS